MKKSGFNMSYENLFSTNMGVLWPIGCTEVIPGDVVSHSTSLLLRLAPLVTPVMHTCDVRIHHFYDPMRNLWEDFEDFMTGGPDGLDDSVFPTVSLSYAVGPPATGTGVVGSLADGLGVVPQINNLVVNAMPFRMYNRVFNYRYRDQDLVDEADISYASGTDAITSLVLQNCAWGKDYLTLARPFESKGPSITIPLGDYAPVSGLGINGTTAGINTNTTVRQSAGISDTNFEFSNSPTSAGWQLELDGNNTSTSKPKIRADLTGASAITITRLREASAMEIYQENNARFGSRYRDVLLHRYGVRSADARIQEPEYLGGSQRPIQFSEVLQTAEGTNPVGTMRGHGLAAMRSNRYMRFIPEFGYVMTFLSIRPRGVYMQGLDRMWNRRTKEDFYTPELAAIGQQEVLYKEAYAAQSTPDDRLGWSDRYQEYRGNNNRVSGEYRTLLKSWHMAREFSSDIALNSDFVSCVPTERIFASSSTDVVLGKAMHRMKMMRIVDPTGRSRLM